jgi:glucose-1-phosphate cytidylyltransferase
MKVAILAGGVGSRLAEETEVKPKPMVEVGGKPILWHIMMYYSQFDFNEFVIALGYKGEVIKKYIVDYCALNSNLTVSTRTGKVEMSHQDSSDWTVNLVDTGVKTQTGGRIKRLQPYVGGERFMLTCVDLGRWIVRCQSEQSTRLSPLAWQTGYAHGRPTDGTVRPS